MYIYIHIYVDMFLVSSKLVIYIRFFIYITHIHLYRSCEKGAIYMYIYIYVQMVRIYNIAKAMLPNQKNGVDNIAP